MELSNEEIAKHDDYIEELFSKKHQFQFNYENIKLPDPIVLFSTERWEDANFIALKDEMNRQKSRLNNYKLDEWHNHTYGTNHAKYISREIRKVASPELLTNAWTKFYECLNQYDIISESAVTSQILSSVHLCEAPGAFITSLNHFIKVKHPQIKLRWMATSLNPYYEGNSLSTMINDDRFMRHTLNCWHFGSDYTGNLMDWNNSQCLIRDSKKKLGKVYLVTADGSIDCSLTPDEQESTVSSLFYCEIITALQILEKGGTFLVKTFTIYEHSSINLIYILCACFNSVNCYKPVTSKSGNSEIYLICIDYKGFEIIEPYLDVFKKHYNSDEYKSKSIIPYEELPKEFVSDVLEASAFFHKYQYDIIGNNILLYKMKINFLYNGLQYIQNKVKETFFETYPFKKIGDRNKICESSVYRYQIGQNFHEKRSNNESYSDMVNSDYNNMDCKLIMINEKFNSMKNNYIKKLPATIDCSSPCQPLMRNCVYGMPIKKICSSLFIDPEILQLYNDINDYFHKDIPFSILHKFEKIKDFYIITFSNYNQLNDYDKWEKSSLPILKSTIDKMNCDQDLHLKNFKILTQYSVGILYLLARNFTTVVFHNVDCIELKKLKDKNALLKIIQDIFKLTKVNKLPENTDTITLLGVIPSRLLFEEKFCNTIYNFNNNNTFRFIKDKLQ